MFTLMSAMKINICPICKTETEIPIPMENNTIIVTLGEKPQNCLECDENLRQNQLVEHIKNYKEVKRRYYISLLFLVFSLILVIGFAFYGFFR